MPWRATSGRTAPWHTASECKVPQRAASEFTLPVRFALGVVCALAGCIQSVPSVWCVRTQIFFPDIGQLLGKCHQTIRRVSCHRGTTGEPSCKPSGSCWASTVHHAICRMIRRAIPPVRHCRVAAYDLALKSQPAGAADIEPNPLDYFAVNPLTEDDLGRMIMCG